jgi:hypothetical protein
MDDCSYAAERKEVTLVEEISCGWFPNTRPEKAQFRDFSMANIEPMKSLHILILLLLVVGVFGVYKWRDGTLHPTISQEGEDFKDAFVVVLGLTAIIGVFIMFCIVPVMRAY